MTWYDVYVGYNDDSFKWEGGNWSGNYPRNGSPRLPLPAPFYELIEKIETGKYEGKQLDWGAYGAKASKEQIVDFIKEYYNDDWLQRHVTLPHIIEQLDRVYDFVLELDSDKTYVLVALET